MWIGRANACLHDLRRIVGIPSGPGAASGLISSMAETTSSSENVRSDSLNRFDIVGGVKSAADKSVSSGLLKTDRN